MSFLQDPTSVWFWVVWAIFLIWQNWAFTFVSRARNSASLRRHALAALQSNAVWFCQFLFAVTAFQRIIENNYGWGMAAFAALYYTAFTMAGSLYAHYRALKKEHGLSAVGASKRYAQIPAEHWEEVRAWLLGQGVKL